MDYKPLDRNKTSSLPVEGRTQTFIKFTAVLVSTPFLIGFIKGLFVQISGLDRIFILSFYWGASVYLLFHIFISEPVKFYKNTQRFIRIVFGFFSPLFRISYYIIPFWALVVILFYVFVCILFKLSQFKFLFFFLSGLVFSLHIVMVAKILKTDELRKIVDYLFIIFIVIIINIFFLSLNLSLYTREFSVLAVGSQGINYGVSLLRGLFNRLFVIG